MDCERSDRIREYAGPFRLVGLGARVVSDQRPEFGWVLLADPEGSEFDLEVSVGELDAD
ncbi:MAG TPA: VOC family protein [Streptosporangiaceae bacterium]|nr:VOC family protein [Streptosporangiaceae bacterium]